MGRAKQLPLNPILKTLGGVGDDYSGWTEAENATDVPHSNAGTPLSYVIEVNKGNYEENFINLSITPETAANMNANYHRVWKCKDGHSYLDSPECRGVPKNDGSCVFFNQKNTGTNYGILNTDPYGEIWDFVINFSSYDGRAAFRNGNRSTTDANGTTVSPSGKFIGCFVWDSVHYSPTPPTPPAGSPPNGFDLGNDAGAMLINCIVRKCDGDGIIMNSTQLDYMYNCTIGDCGGAGINLSATSRYLFSVNNINTAGEAGTGTINKTTCLDGTPSFVDEPNANYKLLFSDTSAKRQGTSVNRTRVNGYTAVNSSTTAGTITFPSSVTLATGQILTVHNGVSGSTPRGHFSVNSGGTGTSFAVTTIVGANNFANGDIIFVHSIFGFDDDASGHIRTQAWDIGAFQQHFNRTVNGSIPLKINDIDVELIKDVNGIVSV